MRTKLIIFALALLAFVGCVPEAPESIEGIVLNLVVADPETRATQDGDDALNENVISNRIDIFFYNENTGVITKEVLQAVRVGTLVQIQTNPNDIETIFGVLSSGAHCGLFVVANFTGTYAGTPGSRTISEIKSSLLPAPTWETYDAQLEAYESLQSSFVMTGEQQVTLGNAQGSTPVYTTVNLSRIAAKVTFDLTVADSASGDTQWVPDKNNMTVYMVYPMRKATLGADPVPMPITATETYGAGETVVLSQYHDKVLYDTGATKSLQRGTGENITTVNAPVYSTTRNGDVKPFYSYPMSWETGSSMEPYMKLIIPWTYGNTTRKYYYKIPFHGNEMLRNHWYHISIDVQILGTEQADPPEVTIHYAIANWSGVIDNATAEDITSVTSVPATVITARYLNIPTTEYVLFNEDSLVIPIQSSHDVEIVGFQVSGSAFQASHQVAANYVGTNPRIYNPFTSTLTESSITSVRPDYSTENITTVSHSFSASDTPDAQGWMVSIGGRKTIKFSHPLNRDLSSDNYDVAPYTIRFRVRHENDATGYYSDITIEQRPSIIIRPEANSGGKTNYGNVYVNTAHANGTNNNNADGSYTSDTQQSAGGNTWRFYLGTAGTNLSNSGNANTNMFVIETSVLPSSGNLANYVLGDPRSTAVDTLPGNYEWRKEATAVQGGTRRLRYYYPAGDEAYDNFIAPKIRFASSFAATQKMTYDDAKRRCASYQEDGYPAGRWRLPTVAEITYVATLNADRKIVRLLGNTSTSQGNTSDYWCNSGYMTVYNGTGSNIQKPVRGTGANTGTKSVRCVYDEWYWEGTSHATVGKTTFTWGDELRSEVKMAD